ncbi:hypothetical protein ACO0LO_22250 [Undibacterium sp. TJN25]|uniref:hypothetical protein n=1 Tax=Undibacterium sp. TJN25 TaxID=3413056 RepID=UPI003BEF5170
MALIGDVSNNLADLAAQLVISGGRLPSPSPFPVGSGPRLQDYVAWVIAAKTHVDMLIAGGGSTSSASDINVCDHQILVASQMVADANAGTQRSYSAVQIYTQIGIVARAANTLN